jgi:hypothetical protein
MMARPGFTRWSRTFAICLALFALVLDGCNSGNGIVEGKTTTRIRVVNGLPDAGPVDLTLDTGPVVTSLPFQGISTYREVKFGTREFMVTTNGGGTSLIDATNPVAGALDYTYLIYGSLSSPNAVLLSDAVPSPENGKFQLRVANIATGQGALDVYLTPPGADISATAPTVGATANGAATTFAKFSSGDFQIRITPAGAKDVIYDAGVHTFAEKSAVNLAIYNNRSSQLVNAMLLNVDTDGTGATADNHLSEFRLVNTSTVASALNIRLDGQPLLANVPPSGVADYQRVAAGFHTVTIEAATTPGAALLTTGVTLDPARDTSIALSGDAGSLQTLVLADNNLPPTAGAARLRFVNVQAGAPTLDVYVNFARQVAALGGSSSSGYIDLTADPTGTAYTLDFNIAGTSTVALALPGVTLIAGKIYTVYLTGPPSALKSVIAVDR